MLFGCFYGQMYLQPNIVLRNTHHDPLYFLPCRLGKEQKASTKKELEAAADAIKLKHGLEKALNHITRDPKVGIPDELT